MISGSSNQVTDLLVQRHQLPSPARAPNPHLELVGIRDLCALMGTDPSAAVTRILDLAMSQCEASSAGISLVKRRHSRTTIQWQQIRGVLEGDMGLETARTYSPCGLALDAGKTVMVSNPERAFVSRRKGSPTIVEQLIVPLREDIHRQPGTVWITHDDAQRQFSSEDARILEQLAGYLELALLLVANFRERVLVQASRATLTDELQQERTLRAAAESAGETLQQEVASVQLGIRDAHHRVKNTLAVAAGLLSMQGRGNSNTQVQAALSEASMRLRLLGNVHEMLERNVRGEQQVDLPRLLERMCDGLREAYADRTAEVTLVITTEAIQVPAAQAIPMLQLTHEAVTNAYKHAFPANAHGTVAIHLSRASKDGIILRIMDNGIGLPATESAGALGWSLMRGLAAQLNAALTIARPTDVPGTVVTVRVYRAEAEDV